MDHMVPACMKGLNLSNKTIKNVQGPSSCNSWNYFLMHNAKETKQIQGAQIEA
jgi:hypothetical protein